MPELKDNSICNDDVAAARLSKRVMHSVPVVYIFPKNHVLYMFFPRLRTIAQRVRVWLDSHEVL